MQCTCRNSEFVAWDWKDWNIQFYFTKLQLTHIELSDLKCVVYRFVVFAEEKRKLFAEQRDNTVIHTKDIVSVSVRAISALYMSKVATQDSARKPSKLVTMKPTHFYIFYFFHFTTINNLS